MSHLKVTKDSGKLMAFYFIFVVVVNGILKYILFINFVGMDAIITQFMITWHTVNDLLI